MMDCKKVLNETNGNMDEAVEYFKKNGQAKAEKKVEEFRQQEGLARLLQMAIRQSSSSLKLTLRQTLVLRT